LSLDMGAIPYRFPHERVAGHAHAGTKPKAGWRVARSGDGWETPRGIALRAEIATYLVVANGWLLTAKLIR
jgi:hypothetical protein